MTMNARARAIEILRHAVELAEQDEREGVQLEGHAVSGMRVIVDPGADAVVMHYANRATAARAVKATVAP